MSLKLQSFCHICGEFHERDLLFVVAPSNNSSRRRVLVQNLNNHCLQKLNTMEKFVEAETVFCSRKDVPKIQNEMKRLWLTPEKVTAKQMWDYCEKVTVWIDEREKQQQQQQRERSPVAEWAAHRVYDMVDLRLWVRIRSGLSKFVVE